MVPRPGKVVCVGLNYRNHILEMGRDLPEHPTLFSKFADTLIGAYDDIVRPVETEAFDWEVELVVVIGTPVRRADEEQAAAAIAGFTVLNDVTCRDWQFRTSEWLQGKIWDATTPVGPVLVTPDELPAVCARRSTITLRGRRRGHAEGRHRRPALRPGRAGRSTSRRSSASSPATSSPPARPAASATPASRRSTCSAARRVVTEIEGIGRLENVVVADPS